MRRWFAAFVLVAVVGWSLCPLSAEDDAEKEEKAEEKKPEPPKVAGFLDIANSSEGSHPGGSTVVRGKWSVDAEAKKLKLLPEPLIDGWLEFGAEIREKPATIQASVRAPSEGRIQSQMGLGLFGKNGFQMRAVIVNDEMELRRRGAVLLSKEFPLDSETLYRMELTVDSEGEDSNNWIVTGRIWPDGEERPGEPLFSYKAWGDELLFPLAGRPAIEAIPYSGEAVVFAGAKAWFGPEPDLEVEKRTEEEDKQRENPEPNDAGGD